MTAENRQIRLPETKKEPAFTVSYILMREARRTLAAKLTEEGLVVKSPLRMALADIEAFLIKNTRWIRKHLAAQKARQDVASLAQLRHGGRFFYRGRMTGLMLGAERTALIERCGQQILCLSAARDASPAAIRGHLRGWLAAQAARLFSGRVMSKAEAFGRIPSAVRLSDAKTSWGTCKSDWTIRLSWRLIVFPDPVIDYVICHELAHLAQMNHSARFWTVVESLDPDYMAHEAFLKQFNIRMFPL